MYELRRMDELSRQDSPLHRRHPLAKLLAALIYLGVLASFGRHEVVRLLPLAVFPVAMAAAGGVPARPILKRLLVAEPLIVCIGLMNPLFERTAVPFGPWLVGAGWLTLASIIIRGTLAVAGALVLTAVTGMDGLAVAFHRLGLPGILVRQISLTYRYLTLLVEESARVVSAYRLRSGMRSQVARKAWGPMAGMILLRTLGRGERVHQAMVLRGFDVGENLGRQPRFGWRDLAFASGWVLFFILVRLYDVTGWLGKLAMGGMR